MSQEITPPDDNPVPGIDHPTVTVPTTETVEPEYSIIHAEPPEEWTDWDNSRTSRLERVLFDAVPANDILGAIDDGVADFCDEYTGSEDILLERVYTRTIPGGETALCVHLRSSYENRAACSRMLLAIDEALREAFFD